MRNRKIGVSNGKAKDLILEYAISEKSSNFSLSNLKKDIFPNKTIDEIKVLVEEIYESEHKTISLKIGRYEVHSLSKGSAKSFLNNGGFEKIEIINKRKEQKEIFDFKVSKFKYYTFWLFFAFALVGFGLGIYNFINSLLPSENVTQQEERIEKMESRIKKIQTLILEKKNIDSLQKNKTIK